MTFEIVEYVVKATRTPEAIQKMHAEGHTAVSSGFVTTFYKLDEAKGRVERARHEGFDVELIERSQPARTRFRRFPATGFSEYWVSDCGLYAFHKTSTRCYRVVVYAGDLEWARIAVATSQTEAKRIIRNRVTVATARRLGFDVVDLDSFEAVDLDAQP